MVVVVVVRGPPPPPPTGPEFWLPNKNFVRAGPASKALKKKFPNFFPNHLGKGGGAGLGTPPPPAQLLLSC